MSHLDRRRAKLFVVTEKPDGSAVWLRELEDSLEVVTSACGTGAWQFMPDDRVCGVVLQLIAPHSHAPQVISTLRTHPAMRDVPYYVLIPEEAIEHSWAHGLERVELIPAHRAAHELPGRVIRDRREGSGVRRVGGRMPTHRLDHVLGHWGRQ